MDGLGWMEYIYYICVCVPAAPHHILQPHTPLAPNAQRLRDAPLSPGRIRCGVGEWVEIMRDNQSKCEFDM